MDASIYFEEVPDDAGLDLVLRYNDLTFDQLAKIADFFGTKSINLGTESRDDGFCDTCSSPYSVQIIRVRGITKRMGKK